MVEQGSTAYQRGIKLSPALQATRRRIPRNLRHVLREGARVFGSATAKSRLGPDFLIIGTKKGGTSSLMNWLLQHPAVAPLFPAPQAIKSPHYFDINYWRGADWYASHFPTQWARRRQEKAVGSLTVVGEASPYYMFHPAVPHRVVSDLPNVRVIVILRDPVSRAYSNYWDRKAFGTEDLPTFEAAIDAEDERMAQVDFDRLRNDPRYYSHHHDHHTYLARGRYAEHLRPWVNFISADNLLIISSDDLYHASGPTFAHVEDFLGIPQWNGVKLAAYNRRLQPPIEPDTKARLREYYRPHNADLCELLGRDFGWS